MQKLDDGHGFFVAEVPTGVNDSHPIKWNPWNKVVQDHRDGTIHHEETNLERERRGLPTPWTPEMSDTEVHQPPVQ